MIGRRWDTARLFARRAAIMASLVAACLWAIDRWVVVGWLRPLWIFDVSMAPHFLGQHVVIRCEHCGEQYPIEPLSERPRDARSTCPGCGQIHELPEAMEYRAGERVRVDRFRRWIQKPRRWEVWAFDATPWRQQFQLTSDLQSSVPMVKRILGLPGERLQFKGGELWVDGRLVQKSLDELHALTVPVMSTESSQSGSDALSPEASVRVREARWATFRPTDESTGWQLGPNGYRFRPRQRGDERFDWLEFQGAGVVGRAASHGRLWDDDSFQQTVSRTLHPMHDGILTAQVCFGPDVQFACHVKTADGEEWTSVWDAKARQLVLRQGERVLATSSVGDTGDAAGGERVCGQIGWAFWDGQWAVCWNGRPLLFQPWNLPGDKPPGLLELKLGARGGELQLAALRLDRDTYWYDPRWEALGEASHAVTLGPSEYFVVGDHLPQSVDSRQAGPVLLERFLGPVRKASD